MLNKPETLLGGGNNTIKYKKEAFTLAEVLITLVIIGVIAAITVPLMLAEYNKEQRKSEFKAFYSTFNNAMRKLNFDNGTYECFYWNSNENPYTGKCSATCKEKDEYNRCVQYVCSQTNEALPADYNGPRAECQKFRDDLFTKEINVVKYCPDHAYDNGCLPKNIKGTNKVKQEANPEYTEAPDANSQFNDQHLKNECPVYVLANGMYVFSYYRTSPTNGKVEDAPVFGVDLNGFRGPNRWGHDIFTFMLYGSPTTGPNQIKSIVYATEPGGKSFEQMLKEAYK